MKLLAHRDLALYVHIPFCEYRCRYCSFYLETGWSPRIMEQTLDAIVSEAGHYVRTGIFAPQSIRTIYIGGGTPSTVPARIFDRFLGRLFDELDSVSARSEPLEEFTVECNPESLDPELVAVLSRRGVTRMSLGIQTFDSHLLAVLGRRCPPESLVRALDILETEWRKDFSLDFITGIPGQTTAQVVSDLTRALKSKPVHLSLYGLTIEPDTPFEQLTRIPAPDGGIRALDPDPYTDLWEAGRRFLADEGYIDYEISNFALPGKESAHNLRYWNGSPYLGIGPGAASTVFSAEGPVRLVNPNLFSYSTPSRPWNPETPSLETLSPRDRLSEHLFTATRTRSGLSRSRVGKELELRTPRRTAARIGSLWDLLITAVRKMPTPEIIAVDAETLAFDDSARAVQNRILIDLETRIDDLIDQSAAELCFTRSIGKNPPLENRNRNPIKVDTSTN